MNTKFNEIMSAAEAKVVTEETQEAMYLASEDFLIQHIANSIARAAKDGKTFCRVFFGISSVPAMLDAHKIAEHLASPLHQLGYGVKVVSDKTIDIKWGKEEEACWDEPF